MSGRVLVTGASGFIGRPLVAALAARGLTVVGASRTRPADICGAAGWIEIDLLAGDPKRLVAEARAETLVHLAWIATPGVYADAMVNTAWLATSANLAAAFLAAGGRRIVGVGSGLECDVGRVGQRTLYGACKNACRLAFERAVAAEPHANLAWARVFFLLGAGDHESRFAPSLARKLVAGEPAPLSTGLAEYDFIDVRDCAEALAGLAACGETGVFDVATGRALRMRDLAERIARRAGRPDLIRIDPALDRPGAPMRLVGDPSALAAVTGFSPRYDIDASIDDILVHWRARSAACPS
jgi:nucleoside-diphosphate-sugar epimerase